MAAKSKKRSNHRNEAISRESSASEALTVAWTVSITTLFFCNIAIVGAHFFAWRYPQAEGLSMMKEMLLMAGSALGVVSLVLLPIVYRVRVVAPPKGLSVFGACLALAPVLAVVVRILQ